MLSSTPAMGVGGMKLLVHSPVFACHTRMVPSLEPLTTWPPSGEYATVLTYDVCPRSSLRQVPDLRPCTRTSVSNEPEATCEPSSENATHVTPSVCALLITMSMSRST